MQAPEPESDLYALLGVQPSASAAAITSAFRARVWELRPDTRVDADTTARFGQVRAAYETLRDPLLRAAYDQRLERMLPSPDRGAAPTVPARPVRRYAVVLGDVRPEPPLRAGPVRWIPGR
ncbi:DnaJ domain-containing protein [Streptomyces sp. NPDC001714]|uniref:DnaJ domain-containing protein n=1 Tax=Streptomyces sp. NPDC001714 TaxID=3364603 RepID=UPI0036CF7B92